MTSNNNNFTNNTTISKDARFTLYTYTTPMDKQGTIILSEYAAKKLEDMIEKNSLIEMRVVEKCSFSLEEILTKGIIINGDADIIDSLQITLPDKSYTDEKPKIVGKFFHGSRKKLFAGLGVDFIYEPAFSDSDTENKDRSDKENNDGDDNENNDGYDDTNNKGHENTNNEGHTNDNIIPDLAWLLNVTSA